MPSRRRTVRFYELRPIDPKSRLADNSTILRALKNERKGKRVGTGELISNSLVIPHEEVVEVRTVRIGEPLAIGYLDGTFDEREADQESGPASPPTFVRFSADGLIGGFQGDPSGDSPTVGRAVSAVSRFLSDSSAAIDGFRGTPVVSHLDVDAISDRSTKIEFSVRQANVSRIQRALSETLGTALTTLAAPLGHPDASVRIIYEDKANVAHFFKRIVSPLVSKLAEDGNHELLEVLKVDSGKHSAVDLLKDELTESVEVDLPNGRRSPSPNEAARVISEAYDTVKHRIGND